MPHGSPRLKTADKKHNLVGRRVRERRKELKLTQDALCGRLAEVTGGEWNPTVYDIVRVEGQRRIISNLELVCLASVLDCSLFDLLGIAATDRATVTRLLRQSEPA